MGRPETSERSKSEKIPLDGIIFQSLVTVVILVCVYVNMYVCEREIQKTLSIILFLIGKDLPYVRVSFYLKKQHKFFFSI